MKRLLLAAGVLCVTLLSAQPAPAQRHRAVVEAEAHVRQGRTLEAFETIRKAPPEAANEIVAWIGGNTQRLDARFLYHLAQLTFTRDRDEAAMWFLAARLWSTYDVKRCKDQSAASGVALLGQLAPNVAAYLFQSADTVAAAATRALKWEESNPSLASPEWICIHGLESYVSALEKKPPPAEQVVDRAEWPRLRTEARTLLQDGVAKFQAQAATAAAPAPRLPKAELLLAPVPQGWKVGWQGGKSPQQQVTEVIPESQTVKDWTRMITMQTHQGVKGRDPIDVVADMAESYKRVCPGRLVAREPQGPPHASPSLRASLLCPGGESMIVLAIQGRDALYFVLYQWRGAEDTTTRLREGNAYLDRVRVCQGGDLCEPAAR